jgi:hypothetical protein
MATAYPEFNVDFDHPSLDKNPAKIENSTVRDLSHSKAQMASPGSDNIPDPIEPLDDYTTIRTMPTTHAQYLSHLWFEQDLWTLWKYISSKTKAYNNSARLDNASWRAWGKLNAMLSTATPETLNW